MLRATGCTGSAIADKQKPGANGAYLFNKKKTRTLTYKFQQCMDRSRRAPNAPQPV